MYNEVIDLLQSSFELTLLHLIYDILANEIDELNWNNEIDNLTMEELLQASPPM